MTGRWFALRAVDGEVSCHERRGPISQREGAGKGHDRVLFLELLPILVQDVMVAVVDLSPRGYNTWSVVRSAFPPRQLHFPGLRCLGGGVVAGRPPDPRLPMSPMWATVLSDQLVP